MKIKDKVIVVTGGANGIGAALSKRFAEEGARAVVVTDRDHEGARAVAQTIGGVAVAHDVSDEDQTKAMVAMVEERFGTIDLYCSNAGIFVLDPGGTASSSNEDWQRIWDINVMSHVYATRAILPGMIKRGGGHFLVTASAAGLLNQIGSAPYSVTKAATVGFAENLLITHGHEGIGVSCLCPQAVRTPMVENLGGPGVAGHDGMLEPEDVAAAVVEGLDQGGFLILPHATVLDYIRAKASDYDRWLGAMQRIRAKSDQER